MAEDLLTISEAVVPEDFAVASGVHGAEVSFLGRVRGVENGVPISGIRYSAYESMAEQELIAIAREIHASFGEVPLRVHHRLGFVPSGEASLFIGLATPHSPAAFACLAEVLRLIKARLPIWKEIVPA
jgi:molybdopterin synthase catalytic subunit